MDKLRLEQLKNLEENLLNTFKHDDWILYKVGTKETDVVYVEVDDSDYDPLEPDYIYNMGVTFSLGYMVVNKGICYRIARENGKYKIDPELFFNFICHHEYGHFRDLYGGKRRTPEECIRDIRINGIVYDYVVKNEITADAYYMLRDIPDLFCKNIKRKYLIFIILIGK